MGSNNCLNKVLCIIILAEWWIVCQCKSRTPAVTALVSARPPAVVVMLFWSHLEILRTLAESAGDLSISEQYSV